MASTVFRGFATVKDVVQRMGTLADWLTTHRPDCHTLTVRRRDFELLKRWPASAAQFQIFTNDGVTYWRGFTLRPDHVASPRDEQRASAENIP